MLSKKEFLDQSALIHAVVGSMIELIVDTLSSKASFHLALAGGEVGGEIAEQLALRINDDNENFDGLHIWWSDERFLAHDSPERNCYPFLASLNSHSAVHVHEASALDSNLDVQTAAKRYSADLSGIDMDLTLLSVGIDGHVASLFPQIWNQTATIDVIPVLNAPKPPSQRISFSLTKINASNRVWLLGSGSAKREILARLMLGDQAIPAAFVCGKQETLLFTDVQLIDSVDRE